MRKILLLIAVILIGYTARSQGIIERYVKGIENVETGGDFIYRTFNVPVLDITYHEFSADSVTWRKNYVAGDCYVRFSNVIDNSASKHPASSWWVYNICTQTSVGLDTIIVNYGAGQTETLTAGDYTINMTIPDTVSGTSTNSQTTTSHTHELRISLNDNIDVNAANTDGYVLKYNGVSQQWEAKPDLLASGAGGSLRVREEDGTPNVAAVNEIRVPNAHLINNGAGSVSLVLSVEPVSGDGIAVDVISGGFKISVDSTSYAHWNQAYNNQVTGVSFAGTTTQTLTLTQLDGGTLTATFNIPTGTTSSSVVTDHGTLTGLSDLDHPASAIINTPFGTVTATTVQSAINELDSEKEPLVTKGNLTENITGLEFSDTRQVIGGATTLTVTSGYIIPTTVSSTSWDTAYNRSPVGLSVAGTDTRTITLTKQDGSTLTATFTAGGTTLPTGTGYLYNDGSDNYNYSIPELSSLLATGVPANQIPYANGSNGINFSALKTINSTSLFGSGNFTLADVGVINTFTTNQNISAASPYLNIINTNGSSAGSGVKFWNESTQERLNIGYNNSTDEAYIYGAFNDPLKVILNGVEQSRFKTDGVFETRNLSSPPSAARSGFGGFYTYNNLPYFINSTGVATQLGSSGGGNVSNTGTPVAGQFPIWTDATTIKGTDNFKVNTNNSTYHSLEIKSPYPGLLLRDSDYDSNPAPNGRYGEIHYDGNNLILGQQAGASYYHAVFGRSNTYFYSVAADATPSNVLYFNSSTGEITYGAKPSSGSGMVWPNNAGIPVYSGSSSWSTSITIPNNTTTFLRGDGTFAAAPSGFADPMTTRGDIIYRNSSNTTTRLGLGLNGQVLSSNGSDLVWATPAGGGNVSNSGTPVSGQLATWNSSTTIYGANVLTTDGLGLNVTSSAGNDPQIKFVDGDVSSRNLTQYFQTNTHTFRYYDGLNTWYPLILKYTGLTTPAIVLTDINTGSYEDINGSIVYNGTDFLGKVGGTWKSLTAGAGGGSGTVTNFSAGNLSPLFTTSVANSTTTPALSFSQVSQAQNLIYASPNGSTGNPSFRKLVIADISATGTPSASTYLRGDGSWASPPGTGTITGVTPGTGLSGGGVSGNVTLNLANTTVTPGSYTNANITVDAQGRITSAASGTSGGSSKWTESGSFTYLTNTANEVGIGYSTDQGAYKLAVNGHVKGDAFYGNILYSATWMYPTYGMTMDKQGSKPTTPAAGTVQIYSKTDGGIYTQNESAVESKFNTWNYGVRSLSGVAPSWDVNGGLNAQITLSGNTIVTMYNLAVGQSGNFTVTNASIAYSLAFSGYNFKISPYIYAGTANTVKTSGGSYVDVYSYYYDGTYVIINGTLSYR